MGAVDQARSKAAQGRAPAYLYWFAWQTSVLDGRPRAFHCAEIPFVFYNSDVCENMTGGGPRARALAAKVADAWIAFARSGNPNHPGLPAWRPYSPDTQPTMVLDDVCRLVDRIDTEELAAIAAA
jgi:para-nitrobenzyl esterase